ncbi:ArsR/SmtB family transcription factor [Actinophytocola oryzae]|uniref:DNA-binding transcriptional ArsR family regulator n=1 Tax=Actinophytocola oryzae TaxID=502181 RepID=A0A4R7V7M0_9PSEU|nr:helix-turn-helix domain-containing protein [Actinophytocola oryzae]TDV44897.1 DNA-binding transcriptional ArsR family regulator [Actinophytocola oryzae]
MKLAEVAAVLADNSRATMCMALIDGRAWTVGELAHTARVAPSTASEHVRTLTDAGFVRTLKQGRHRYIRLAGPQVAELIERLSSHAGPEAPRGLRASVRARRLGEARTCYDHLAGRLGVALRDGMFAEGLLSDRDGLAVTSHGRNTLTELGVELPNTRRALLRDCLDWTERREHLAGALPAAILTRALAAGWLVRDPHRAITINDSAWSALSRLGITPDGVVADETEASSATAL